MKFSSIIIIIWNVTENVIVWSAVKDVVFFCFDTERRVQFEEFYQQDC